jgi:hypothetical protein
MEERGGTWRVDKKKHNEDLNNLTYFTKYRVFII